MISRGQIHFVNLSPTRGREQAGRRPVLVVSSDAINRQPLVATVVVGTNARNVPREYPTNVRVSARETGLPRDTMFLCFQMRSLDASRFFDPKTGRLNLIGTMPPGRMRDIDNALKLVLKLQAFVWLDGEASVPVVRIPNGTSSRLGFSVRDALNLQEAGQAIETAVVTALVDPRHHTADLGGRASTATAGNANAAALRPQSPGGARSPSE